MRRHFLQHKERGCPAIILFRYSDRETITIFEDKGCLKWFFVPQGLQDGPSGAKNLQTLRQKGEVRMALRFVGLISADKY